MSVIGGEGTRVMDTPAEMQYEHWGVDVCGITIQMR